MKGREGGVGRRVGASSHRGVSSEEESPKGVGLEGVMVRSEYGAGGVME